MRKMIIAAGLGATLIGLAGCSHGGGLNRQRPDEFAVTRAAPLVIPPDFALVPPKPGAPSPAISTDSGRDALETMFGGPAPRSAGEAATLTAAGRDNATPGIRSSVGGPGNNVVDKGATTRDILAAPEGDGQNAKASTPQ